MPDERSCPICGKELHSIITRRVGNFAVCIDCGDTLNPFIHEIADNIVELAKITIKSGVTIDSMIPQWRSDMGLPKKEIPKPRDYWKYVDPELENLR